MKNILLFAATLATLIYAFRYQLPQSKEARFEQFISALDELLQSKDKLSAQEAYREARMAYKKLEGEWSYLSNESVQQWINGAPLPKLVHGIPGNEIREPQGLQRLEELVYETPIDLHEVRRITKLALIHTKEDARYYGEYQMSELQLLEAAQLQIIRTLSLGITGFDTPASDRAIAESAVALHWMYSALQDGVKKYSWSSRSYEQAMKLWVQAVDRLSAGADFESFNRALYVRESLVPLYRSHVQLRKLYVERMPSKRSGPTRPFNWDEEFLFSSDLIDSYAYSKLKREDHTASLEALGKSLFHEVELSLNRNLSCGSCHNPELAFQDGQTTSFSGRSEQDIKRNTPTLINVAQSPTYLWDNSVKRLEQQFIHVFRAQDEFNISFLEMEERLMAKPEYKEAFAQIFPGSRTSFRARMEAALSAYLHSLTQYESKFDAYMAGLDTLTSEEELGFNLFMGKAACATCHFAPTFSGLVPPLFAEMEGEVLGVLDTPVVGDLHIDDGKYGSSTVNSADFHKYMFKTVGIRNSARTAPYMHNGAYNTLEDVVAFYNHGGALGVSIDLPNQTLPGDSLGLTDRESKALVAFMHTLNSGMD